MPVEYLPYFAVIAHLDAKDGLSSSSESDDKLRTTLSEFTSYCWSRRLRLEAMTEAWAIGRAETCRASLGSWLYNPLCYETLSGSADGLAVVLLDDFDAYHFLGSAGAGILDDLDVTVCPDMEKIVAECIKRNAIHEAWRNSFCNLHEFWSEDPELKPTLNENASVPTGCEARFVAVTPKAIQNAPVVVMAQCKLEGMLAMDLAGWIVEEILYTMGTVILESLHELATNQEAWKDLYSLTALQKTRITFLHGQGTHEITAIIMGANASIATALLAAIRDLTVDQVLQGRSDWGNALKAIFNAELKGLGKGKWDWVFGDSLKMPIAMANSPGTPSGLDLFKATPLFRWTLSSVGVSCDNEAKLEGWVAAASLLQITPAGYTADNTEKKYRDLADVQGDGEKKPDPESYYLRLMGLYDAIVATKASGVANLIKTEQFALSLNRSRSALAETPWGGLAGLTRLLQIPLPSTWHHEKRHANTSDTNLCNIAYKALINCRSILESRISKLADVESGLSSVEIRKLLDDKNKGGIYLPLRLHLIQQIPKVYGLPQALRQSITTLFQRYLFAITDVHLFDLAIDLLDAFATLHHILCQILPRKLLNLQLPAPDGDIYITQLIHPEIVIRISGFASALHRAFEQRIHRAYPEIPSRGKALDLQGDVHAFIQAADAPLKCGVGIAANETSLWAGMTSRRRDVLGVFTNLGFSPGIKSVTENLGVEQHARIAFFDSDVPHLMQVGAYVDYLHESAHVALETLVCHRGNFIEYCPTDQFDDEVLQKHKAALDCLASLEDNESAWNRLNEIFVHSLTYKLVCPPDRMLFLRNFISRFSSDPENSGFPAITTIHRFAEVFSVLYLGSYCLIPGENDSWKVREIPAAESDELREDFTTCFEDIALCYGPYEHAATGEVRRWIFNYVYAHLVAVINDLGSDLNRMVQLAWFVFSLTARKQVPNSPRERWEEDFASLRFEKLKVVRDSIENGRVVHVHECLNDSVRVSHDPLMLCGLLLHAYLWDLREPNPSIAGKRRNINLPEQTGRLTPKLDPNIAFHDFVLIHGSGTRTYVNPEKRRLRLRRQIAVLRSFWSMAANFKGRRFCTLMSYCRDKYGEEIGENVDLPSKSTG